MKEIKFHIISLGCPKNQVDSEEMFTRLKKTGFTFNPDIKGSDLCIINTCGFLETARKESIDVIIEIINHKQKGNIGRIIVAGCMVNNYIEDLKRELPEVDSFISTFDENAIAKIAKDLITNDSHGSVNERIGAMKAQHNNSLVKDSNAAMDAGTFANNNDLSLNKHSKPLFSKRTDFESGELNLIEREHFNLKRTTYLKISEGCNKKCSFCIIPSIRGAYKSKNIDDIKKEAIYLAGSGVKELVIISQDTSYYGIDLNIKNGLYKLLKELVKINGIKWIRLMYLYPHPSFITDELIDIIKNEEKILKYIDMPIQHIGNKILELMKRSTKKEDIVRLIKRFKAKIPNIALRTSLIAGFPGENEEDFNELVSFVKDTKFDNLGVFKYSDEHSAESFGLKDKVKAKIKNERYKILMETQQNILPEILSKHISKSYDVIIDGISNKIIKARTYFQAPDVDGYCYVYIDKDSYQHKEGKTTADNLEIRASDENTKQKSKIKRLTKTLTTNFDKKDFIHITIMKQNGYDLYAKT